jgi:hypothetical protein
MATATTPGTNRFGLLVESICRSLDVGRMPDSEDFRQLMTQLQTNVQAALPGGNWIVPGGSKSVGAASPSGVQFSVSGSNGQFQWQISNPANAQGQTIWHEVSYGPLKSFTQSVTTLSPTAGTNGTVAEAGQTFFFRLRSSYDLRNWTSYQLASTSAIGSGKVSSAATSDAGAFNQTNYGVVTSAAVGSTAEVQIQGASGPLTSLVAQKGPSQTALPGATVVGVTPGSDQFVGWDGSKYILRSTLGDLLASDNITPIGKVSVVETGVPTLPAVSLVLGSGGAVIAWNVTSQGNGLTAPVTLTIVTGTGTGATAGTQTIEAGKLISVAPGNPGAGYVSGDTVTVTGGTGGGTPGGGTAAGGNGGRLTAV